jgi:hypothetical protein
LRRTGKVFSVLNNSNPVSWRCGEDAVYGWFPKVIIDEAIALCDESLVGTDDAVESEYLGRSCFYGKKKDANFKQLDGKIATIAYRRDKIHKAKPHDSSAWVTERST